jgi:hypothetical protein
MNSGLSSFCITLQFECYPVKNYKKSTQNASNTNQLCCYPENYIIYYVRQKEVMIMSRDEIKGLYFPYANIRSAKTLKTAVLYFDKIGVIDPRANFCGESDRHRNLHYESENYVDEIKMLVEEGIVDLIDSTEVIAKFGNEITMGVIQDLHDSNFLRVCEPFVHSSWVISSAKLPDDADKWLRNVLVNVPTLAQKVTTFREGNVVKEQLKEELLRGGARLIER